MVGSCYSNCLLPCTSLAKSWSTWWFIIKDHQSLLKLEDQQLSLVGPHHQQLFQSNFHEQHIYDLIDRCLWKILWRYNIWLKITDLQINPNPPMNPLGFVQYNVIVVLALHPPGEWGRPSPLHQHLLPSALLVWPLHTNWTQSEQHCTFE